MKKEKGKMKKEKKRKKEIKGQTSSLAEPRLARFDNLGLMDLTPFFLRICQTTTPSCHHRLLGMEIPEVLIPQTLGLSTPEWSEMVRLCK
jgi:hypothetical protein